MPARRISRLRVDVVDVEVDRLDALLEAALQPSPIPWPRRMRGTTSNGISRSGRFRLAVDREGDADAAEQKFRLAPPLMQDVSRDLSEPAGQFW